MRSWLDWDIAAYFVAVIGGLVLYALACAWIYIRELESCLAAKTARARTVHSLRVQREIDRARIASYESEIRDLKARILELTEP